MAARGTRAPLQMRRFVDTSGVTAVLGISGSSVAIPVTADIAHVTAAGASTNTLTIAAGYPGQEMTVYLIAKGGAGNGVIGAPTNLWGGTTYTLSAADQMGHLKYINGKWAVVGGTGALA